MFFLLPIELLIPQIVVLLRPYRVHLTFEHALQRPLEEYEFQATMSIYYLIFDNKQSINCMKKQPDYV